LPFGDEDLTDPARGAEYLAGYGHQDDIGPLALVSIRADDDAGRFLMPV